MSSAPSSPARGGDGVSVRGESVTNCSPPPKENGPYLVDVEAGERASLLPRRAAASEEDARGSATGRIKASYALVMLGALVMCACLAFGLGASPPRARFFPAPVPYP